ncbi:MAG: hypothetical protein ACR2F6_09805 [Mycobacteriales bacterium]
MPAAISMHTTSTIESRAVRRSPSVIGRGVAMMRARRPGSRVG